MKKCFLIALAAFPAFVTGLQAVEAQNQNPVPAPEVTLFAPGGLPTTATNSAAPAFSPDGKIVLLGQSSGGSTISIMQSHREGKNWSVPEFPTFSGKYHDLEPAFSPDGKYLIFASNRPATARGTEIDGYYNGNKYPGSGGNLWRVDYRNKAWGTPTVLPSGINANGSVFSPAIAGDGSLYFMRADSGAKFHIYRAQMRNGQFESPVPASFTINKYGDYDPAVAPDESFIIFSSPRPPAPEHTADLFIAFRDKNGWGDPIDLRSLLSENVYGVEARLSPDGNTLYFSNSRNASGVKDPKATYTWKVDISRILKAHGLR